MSLVKFGGEHISPEAIHGIPENSVFGSKKIVRSEELENKLGGNIGHGTAMSWKNHGVK